MSFFDHFNLLRYSDGLHQQLKGRAVDCVDNSGDAAYPLISIVLLSVSIIVMLNYYYGLFNNPRFTHRRTWLLNIVVASCMVGFFAYFQATRYLPEEKHCDKLHFNGLDCILFAFTAMIYTAITCILFSLLFKWKSISNKKVPF
jgi:hypothetical protein